MRTLTQFGGAALLCIAAAAPARAEVIADECGQQFSDVAVSDMNCIITYTPSDASLAFVIGAGTPGPELDELKVMLEQTKCEAQISVPKDEVTSTWFTADAVALPPLPVTCDMVDAGGETLEITTNAKVDCDRPDGQWACSAVISDTSGLSFLGGVLEGMINGNEGLSGRLGNFVTDVEQRFGVGADG